MRLRRKEFCPIHRSLFCCGRERAQKERRFRLGVQRIEDPHHPRGYRELRSQAEMRNLLNRKIVEQSGKCAICNESFTDCSEIAPDHICALKAYRCRVKSITLPASRAQLVDSSNGHSYMKLAPESISLPRVRSAAQPYSPERSRAFRLFERACRVPRAQATGLQTQGQSGNGGHLKHKAAKRQRYALNHNIEPKGMGAAWRDDHPENIQAVHWGCNSEKGSERRYSGNHAADSST